MNAQEQIRQSWLGMLGQIAEYNQLQDAGDENEMIVASGIIEGMQDALISIARHEGWLLEALSALDVPYRLAVIVKAGEDQATLELPATADEIGCALAGFGADLLEREEIKVAGMSYAPYRIEGIFDGEVDLAELNTLTKLIALCPEEAIVAERYIEQAQTAPADITEIMNCIATAHDSPRYDAFTYEELRDMTASQWELSRLAEPLELHDRLPEDKEPLAVTIPIPNQRTQATSNPAIDSDARRTYAGAQTRQVQTIEAKAKEASR